MRFLVEFCPIDLRFFLLFCGASVGALSSGLPSSCAKAFVGFGIALGRPLEGLVDFGGSCDSLIASPPVFRFFVTVPSPSL